MYTNPSYTPLSGLPKCPTRDISPVGEKKGLFYFFEGKVRATTVSSISKINL